MVATELPKTMRAAQGKDYGPIDEMISVEDGVPVPRLDDLPEKKRSTSMIVRTHAVSLAPGDCRVLSGLTRELQGPPSFPYIPGGDASGVVVVLPEEHAKDLPFASLEDMSDEVEFLCGELDLPQIQALTLCEY